MSAVCHVLNRLCMLLHGGEYRTFMKTCSVEKVQENYLMELLHKNADTVYGNRYGFADITSYDEFARQVPLTVYEDYEPLIEEIAEGKKKVLTEEDVLLFELTSGSSGGKKWIPYTKTLKQEFQRGIKPWLYDLYRNVDGICGGKSYWSITPVTAERSYTKSGIPIGFEEDAEYFGSLEKKIMEKMFAVGPDVKFCSDMQGFYWKTAKELLRCGGITLISVWNPTYLTILCDFIKDHVDELVEGLSPERGRRIVCAARADRFDQVFPGLRLISCWADASAADVVEPVKQRFPGVLVQPKGLLATECFVSVPLLGEEGSRLSIYSHFFEFRRLEDGKIIPAAGLTKGEYELIVTTGGGFYRYVLGDIVEVLETYRDRPPRLRFLRRGGVTSDRFGEKLTEQFVAKVLIKLGLGESFCLLAPEGSRYCLYTDAGHVNGKCLDAALCESFHYEYCRKLGQLEQAAVILVRGNPEAAYMRRLTAEGMRLGDIKPARLSRKDGWGIWFD